MEQSSRNFQPFLSYRNCKAIFFLFQKMFYRIYLLGSYERILLNAFQFWSIVYFTVIKWSLNFVSVQFWSEITLMISNRTVAGHSSDF